MTGEKNKIFGGKKYNDYKFPKRKRRIPYKSPVVKNYIVVEHDHGYRHDTNDKTSHKERNRKN